MLRLINRHWASRVLVSCLWLSLVAAGFWLLLSYESLPGRVDNIPGYWPNQSQLTPLAGSCTLIMFVHPKCPCTSASLNELAVLMTRCRRLKAFVLLLSPSGLLNDWEKTDHWYHAANIKGVTVHSDMSGQEAAIFKATTSGQTIVYSPDGKLVFNGGITAGRGHEGDNQGLDTVISVANEGSVKCHNSPVFGCSLADDPNPNGGVITQCLR